MARNNKVSVHSSKPYLFSNKIKYIDSATASTFESNLALVSIDHEKVLSEAELVLITLPTTIIQDAVEKIEPYVNADSIIGYLPGAGGVEFLSAPLIAKGCCIFGFERVPYVARLKEYGHVVAASKKDKYRISVFPKNRKKGLANKLAQLFDRPCTEMGSFLSMTLTQTLHTSRLYDLYEHYNKGELLPDNPYFYVEWRDSASRICLQLDDELHTIAQALSGYGLDVSELVPYRIH